MTLRSVLCLVILLFTCIGCDHSPTQPAVNRDPAIASLIAFPSSIGPGDSTIVICDASDADGNTLRYDWVTDARLVIKGKSPNDNVYFNSPYNTQVFYYGIPSPFDSAWVECDVQDGRGGVAIRKVRIALTH